MKKLLCIAPLALLLCFTTACKDNAAKADRDEIVKGVNAAADNLASAISRLDAEGVTNLFSKADGTKYISDGAFIPRDDLREAFRSFYGALKEMNFSFEKKDVSVLSQDIAVLTSWAHYTAVTKEGQNIDERAIFTTVYKSANGTWSIFQAHKSIVK